MATYHGLPRMFGTTSVIILTLLFAVGCAQMETNTGKQLKQPRHNAPLFAAPITTWPANEATINGRNVSVAPLEGMYAGFFIPDGRGGQILVGSDDLLRMPPASLEDAREFDLKIQELGDQLFSVLGSGQQTDLPTSTIVKVDPFTSLEPTSRQSAMGTYIAMQLKAQCARNGIAALERSGGSPGENPAYFNTHRVVGTYHFDAATLTLTARLINQSTGTVLAGGTEVMTATPFVRRLLADNRSRFAQIDIPIREPLAP